METEHPIVLTKVYNVISKFGFLILTLILSSHGSARAAGAEPSALVRNPLAMTMTQALAVPSGDDFFAKGTVNVRPERPATFLLEANHDARFKFRLQPNRTAPFVFVLPGTGGMSSSPAALFLAEKLYRRGNHVVSIDNPFSWTFAVSTSRSARPGFPQEDAADLYDLMQKIRAKLIAQNGIAPSSYSIVGYSLGALQSVFVKRLDDQAQVFCFQKVLMINPAVDLLYALGVLDRFHEQSARLPQARRDWAYGRVLTVGEKYLESKQGIDFSNPAFLEEAFGELKFKNADMIYLISKTFREGLRDVVFASQQVHDLGVLKNPVTRYQRNARYEEAAKLSFRDYVGRILFPSLKTKNGAGYTIEELNTQASLYQFGDYLKSQPRIFVVTSADDFILKPSDSAWLKDTFGQRLIMLPYGGHCGDIVFPQMNQILAKFF